MTEQKEQFWWGNYEIRTGNTARIRLGSTVILVARRPSEWRVASTTVANTADDIDVQVANSTSDLMEYEDLSRLGVSGERFDVRITPVAADRPVVAKPERPLTIMAEEKLKVFVSSPLWVRVELGAERKVILDRPISRPSDTWFGADTCEGELCYASRSFYYTERTDLRLRPDRAITALTIENATDEPMPLSRVKLPAQNLSVIRTEGGFWTEDITWKRFRRGDMAELKIGKTSHGAPVVPTMLISGPRFQADESLVSRAFGTFFSRGV